MKILIINYFYPPIIDAHAYRWGQISKFWANDGHHVDVVTSKVQGLPYHSVESKVNVFRIGVKSKVIVSGGERQEARKGGLVPRLLKDIKGIAMLVYRKLYWPDSAWHWIPSVISDVFKKRHENYDLVVSYYPCFAAHIAGTVIRAVASGRASVWVADYGDPFSVSDTMQPNNYSIYGYLNKLVERKLIKDSDFFVLTNKETANAYARLGGANPNGVIPHLVDVKNYYLDKRDVSSFSEKLIVLTYIGGFHREVRPPDRLFDLIRQLNNLGEEEFELNIYGPLNSYSLEELTPKDCNKIFHKGLVERGVATRLLQEAEIIVNVDNENCIMTPSKIVECIGTGNPIVNLSNDSVNYEPLENYTDLGFAVSLKQDEVTREDALIVREFILSRRLEAKVPLAKIEEILSEHSLEAIANEYLSFVSRND